MSKDQAAAKSYKTTNKKKDDDDPGKLIKPADQLELSEAELKEEMTRTLTARNPHAPQNIAHYKFNDGAYKLTTAVNHMAVHFVLEGCLEHQDFDDSHSLTATEELTEDATGEGEEESDEGGSGDGGEEEAGEDDIPDSAASKANNEPKCTNQFNFIERASQTINNPLQGRSCQTVPPPRYNYYATAFQWDIYDVYMAELQKQEVKKEKQKDKSCEKNKKMMLIEKPISNTLRMRQMNLGMRRALFSPCGSSTMTKPKRCVSLPSVGSGVLSLDIHKQHSYLVAVGFYDGCVCVYNLKKKGLDPQYKSTIDTGKHTDPVWQVRWQNDNSLNFYSVSSDGRVVSWMLIKNELLFSDALRLALDYTVSDGLEGIQELIRSSGTSFDFHTQIDDLFIVGTKEGKIHKCSKNYSSQYLKTYDGHNMAVDTVRWNPYHPKVFISCSSDWTVKIWDQDFNPPMFTFELNASVGDVAWAPYSSTVFAAVTTEGLVHVFDLAINKYQAICQQPVVNKKKTKLTHIEFNPVEPVIIVGDDRGSVISLKLSPNLRKKPKGKKGRDLVEGPEAEVAKIEKLLSLLRH
ncbi:dynein axonemal intermediate chain 1-like isoform X3 [Phycodurus eques]|uniref:dynein axonemal intermediate chain 1-like isoform X3 n=1 Tax=Phycodurus eques TaxID=693459 RepID=UPI002ACED86D|nr:dynein axonemal intermediate chain 1-like isoform X3 [Phycodurus eques]